MQNLSDISTNWIIPASRRDTKVSRPLDPDLIQRRWPLNEQPMTRLFTLGPQALSDAEILSILLRKGGRNKSAVDLARELLAQVGGISGLLATTSTGILQLEAQARIFAANELVRRALKEKITNGSALNSPTAVREYLRLKLQALPHEVFVVIMLDAQNRVIEIDELFRGTLTQTSVYPREVVKRALHLNAAAVLFCHNNPSGVAEPSHADEALTRGLKQALALVDVRVLDHFIVAGAGIISFAERGLLLAGQTSLARYLARQSRLTQFA